MGLDLTLFKYLGQNKDGSISTESFYCDEWISDRYAVRKDFIDTSKSGVEFEWVASDVYMDPTSGFRPKDFSQIDEFVSTLDSQKEKDYILNIKNILEDNPDVYLSCNW